MTEGLFWSPSLARTLDHWAATLSFDAALVYCSSMLPYVHQRMLRGIPRVVDLVDVDSQKWQEYALRSSGWRRLFYELESKRVRRLERETSETAHAITLASDAEAALFRAAVSNTRPIVHGVCNGVDTEFFDPLAVASVRIPDRPLTNTGISKLRMVFVGVLDYFPNVEGLRWFATHVWPRLKRLVPSATLEIIGRNPTSDIKRIATDDGMTVVGSVDDVRPYLAGADLVIAPLWIARGIQNKVLEAMAMGKPVLATPPAAEGIDAEKNKHFIVADSPTEWVQALVHLFQTPELQEKIGKAARQLILDEYTWAARLDRLNALLGIAKK